VWGVPQSCRMRLKLEHLRHPIRTAVAAKERVAARLNMKRCAESGERRFRGDPRYARKSVTAGFASRLTPMPEDEQRRGAEPDDAALLQRICSAYIKAVDDEAGAPAAYRATAWWERIRQHNLKPAMQALVSREISPHEPVVLTIGAIHGGTAFNIIPERCELLGTLRTFDPQVRRYLLERVEGLARGLTAAFRAEATVHTRASCPAVVNDRELTELVRRAAAAELGEAAVVDTRGTLGGDDMADYLALRPGCYFFVGARNEARGLDRSHHNPGFDFDEAALEVAARVLGRATLAALTEA